MYFLLDNLAAIFLNNRGHCEYAYKDDTTTTTTNITTITTTRLLLQLIIIIVIIIIAIMIIPVANKNGTLKPQLYNLIMYYITHTTSFYDTPWGKSFTSAIFYW